MIDNYFHQIAAYLADSGIVSSSNITYDRRSLYIGFIRGDIYFLDGSVLHLREFINVQHGIDRYTYVYHYQCADGNLLFRYDNTPHFPDLPTFPHHKHAGSESNVVSAEPPDLPAVLTEIRRLMTSQATGQA